MLPKIRRCPCCNTISLIKVNGVSYQNGFESLSEWNLKKIFNCRKCNVQLGLFSDKLEQKDKLIWLGNPPSLWRLKGSGFHSILFQPKRSEV